MKALFTFACIFIASSSFAQQDMFWNNYSNINPAMSGFQNQQHAAISYSDYFQRYRPKNVQANYNIRLADKHGLGFNFTGNSFWLNQTSTVLNYNYQFNLGKAGRISAGVGAGLNTISENTSYNAFDYYDVQPQTYFQLNAGVAYKWKGLTAGISLRNLTKPEVELDSALVLHTRTSLNIHAEYDFNIGKQFQLTPRFAYGPIGNNHRLNTDLTLTFRDKFSVGVMYDFNSRIGTHIGWDITEKFRVSYMFNSHFSGFNPNTYLDVRHQVTLGFKL